MLFKETLLKDNNIIRVLEYYNFANIIDRGKEIRCGFSEDTNPTSIRIFKNESITATDFARNISGDIFTLIMENRCKKFKDVIFEIRNILGIDVHFEKEKESSSIANVYNDLVFKKEDYIPIYNEKILNEYENAWNLRFYRDGISINTQKKFNIMYDNKTNRIIIPHRNEYGDICGIVGRLNKTDCDEYKYFPLIPFKKSKTLFGYSQNYSSLYNSEVIYIGEAEKFVMQLDSLGYNNALSLSGVSLSKEQIFLIARLNPKKIVFCFDEGLDILQVYRIANKFKFFTKKTNITVGVLLDKENTFLKKGSKSSPTDCGIEGWNALIENCIEYI